MRQDEITLVHPEPPKPRYVRLAVDGPRFERTSWAGNGKARHGGKTYASESAARLATERETIKRMQEGFVLLRGPDDVTPGGIVMQCAVPNRGASDFFDLHPDGHTLAVGTMLHQGYGAEIHLIDIRTGRRQPVHAEPVTNEQTFIHAVLFDADGRGIVYAVNGETRYLDLDTGASTVIASYRQFTTARFNPFRLRPAWDQARNRLLVFHTDDVVRVLDAAGNHLLEVPTRDRPECQAGALSRSGRLLALSYELLETEIWDVDTGELLATHPFPVPFDRSASGLGLRTVGFDPTELLVVAEGGYAEGPAAMSVESGELEWAIHDPYRTDRWGTCHSWSYSPDGRLLAVGGHGRVELRDADTRELAPDQLSPSSTGHTRRVVFSTDGKLIVAGGGTGRISVHLAGQPTTTP
ncbi:WD40 repeat domain-containing protein [Micromonospora polyrhachis]|uniref:WD40 repeat protein n=1 Tax=Micromonospora polyrhachis TaxID=1282883 RepID=A0A7W7SMW2_9ACTN|nr:WD40 repeat domain-containing protein [Micromonospora polyrhachis]MBB4957673.1 WD40 repeat protein [Micromonospora polyrhachis]